MGDTVTFTVTLTNAGPDSATGVTVNDLLPAGLVLVSAVPSRGSYDPASGAWTVGTVAPEAPQTLRIQARVAGTGPQTNTATVRHSDQFDPDPTNNGSSATATPQWADLAVAKTAGPGPFAVGQQITYTLTVTNRGPSLDPDVTLVDLLPSGVTFVSASVVPASQTGGSLTFRLGPLAAGESAAVTVVVRADAAGTLVNQATVTGALADLDPSNDAASLTTITQAPPTDHAGPADGRVGATLRLPRPADEAGTDLQRRAGPGLGPGREQLRPGGAGPRRPASAAGCGSSAPTTTRRPTPSRSGRAARCRCGCSTN